VVERGVGEHDAKVGVARSHLFRDGGAGTLAEQHDRAAHRLKEFALGRLDLTEGLSGRSVSDHESERFFIAVFAVAQFGDCGPRTGIAGEVVSAQPLQSADPASAQSGCEVN
jgi:hypothetical protein